MQIGYKVRYVRNITDVGQLLDDGEDRMSKGARLEKKEPMEALIKYTIDFNSGIKRTMRTSRASLPRRNIRMMPTLPMPWTATRAPRPRRSRVRGRRRTGLRS